MGTKGVESQRVEVIKEPMNTEALKTTGVYILRSFGVDTTWINGNTRRNMGLNRLVQTAQMNCNA